MWYFIKWLGRRVQTKLFKTNQYRWVENYRDLIMREKPLAILLTVLLGAVWFIGSTLVVIALAPTTPRWFMNVNLAVPPLFFVYHWIGALHEIYSREREKTLDYLKESS